MADLAHAPPGPSDGSAQALRGGPAAAGGARAGTVHASFPPAGQPDVIRAAQKDDYYVQVCVCPCLRVCACQACVRGCARLTCGVCCRRCVVVVQRLRETLLDVFQRVVGTPRTLAWEEEVRSLVSTAQVGPQADSPEHNAETRRNRCLWPARCCTTASPPASARPRWGRSTATCSWCVACAPSPHTQPLERVGGDDTRCAGRPVSGNHNARAHTGRRRRSEAAVYSTPRGAGHAADGGAVCAATRAARLPPLFCCARPPTRSF